MVVESTTKESCPELTSNLMRILPSCLLNLKAFASMLNRIYSYKAMSTSRPRFEIADSRSAGPESYVWKSRVSYLEVI